MHSNLWNERIYVTFLVEMDDTLSACIVWSELIKKKVRETKSSPYSDVVELFSYFDRELNKYKLCHRCVVKQQ